MHDIELIDLQLRNFSSYGNNVTTIPLSFDSTTLVIGENHDSMVDGELDSNGAGKTSILNGITYAGYGRTISKIKVDKLINNINKRNLYVAMRLRRGDVYYMIERWRKNSKMGGSANCGVKITYGDALDNITKIKTPATRSIDEYIADHILGMPFEIFVRIVVYSAKYQSFLNLPITHTTQPSQTSILEELFGLTELTEKAIKLKTQIKTTTASITALIDLNARISLERARYEEQLELAEESVNTWEVDHTDKIAQIKEEIAELEKIDFIAVIAYLKQLEKTLKLKTTIDADIKTYQTKYDLNKVNQDAFKQWVTDKLVQVDKLAAKILPYQEMDPPINDQLAHLKSKDGLITDISLLKLDINDIDDDIEGYDDKQAKFNAQLDTLRASKCPMCKQVYDDNEDTVAEIDSKLDKVISAHKSAQIRRDRLSTNQTDKQTELKLITDLNLNYATHTECSNAHQLYDNLISEQETLESSTNPYTAIVLSEKEMKKLSTHIKQKDGERKAVNIEMKQMKADNNYHEMYTMETAISEQNMIDELKRNLITTIKQENPHTKTIKRLERAFDNMDEINTDGVDELKVLQKHQNFMLKLLTKKDSFIRQALLDANLPLLNTRLRHYLSIIGLPHNVMFTKEMQIAIDQFGNSIDFDNLSGGQQARINLGIAFAFRDVVQARHQKINFCILDECLDTGLSNLGIKLAARMIKQVADENNLSMYVITHRDEIKTSFDKTVTTVLKGGLTTVEFN